MIMAIGPRVSKICRGRRSWGSGHNEIDYNLLKMLFGTICTIELECIVNGLALLRFVLCECFWLSHICVFPCLYESTFSALTVVYR